MSREFYSYCKSLWEEGGDRVVSWTISWAVLTYASLILHLPYSFCWSDYIKKRKLSLFPLQCLFSEVFFLHSQYRLAIPLSTNCSRKTALSQKQSIISVIIFVMPVSCIARRRMLYAYFLMSDRLFRDFLAGERSSLNVSSNTWWSRFSIDQCILFMPPSSSAVRIRSDISVVVLFIF